MLIREGGTVGFGDRRNMCVSEISSLSENGREMWRLWFDGSNGSSGPAGWQVSNANGKFYSWKMYMAFIVNRRMTRLNTRTTKLAMEYVTYTPQQAWD
jgi:hypothetical protein